jgi:2-oxoglutarate ferredoxin oxidoreductase subunit delta
MKKAATTKSARPKTTRPQTARPKSTRSKTIQSKTAQPTPVQPKKARGEVIINRERCKGCGLCVEFCPVKGLVLDTALNRLGYHPPLVKNALACTGCDLCGWYCPDFAIYGVRLSGGKEEADEG